MKRAVCLSGAAIAAGLMFEACGGVVFQEDFTHYCDRAPGVTEKGFSVYNEPIGSKMAAIDANGERDADIFLKPIALPAGDAFDVLFNLRRAATNSQLEVVFADGAGKTTAVPVACPNGGWRKVALKAAGGKVAIYWDVKDALVKQSEAVLPAGEKTVNFRVRKGGSLMLTKIVVRTPGALEEHPALAQYADMRSVLQDFGAVKVLTSDGKPLAVAGKSLSFVPGKGGKFGSLSFTWSDGKTDTYALAATNSSYAPVIPSFGLPELGIQGRQGKRPQGRWYGPDAVIELGRLATLYVRPNLKCYCGWRDISPAGVDLVRDWDKLPKASQHRTTLEIRKTRSGASQLWLDGSFVTQVKPGYRTTNNLVVVKAELTLDAGVKYCENKVDENRLALWANPKGKSFVEVAPNGADVGICRSFKGAYGLEGDAYASRTPLDGYPAAVHYRLPAGPYTQARIRFVLDDAPNKVPYLTVRIARYDNKYGAGCTTMADNVYDFRKGLPSSVKQVGKLTRKGKDYPIYEFVADLPLGKCLDYAVGDFFDLEFVGLMQDKLQQIDNSQKPRTDVLSAFTLLDVELIKLRVLPELVQASPGNVFTEDEKVKTTSVKLTALADGAKGEVRFGRDVREFTLAKAGDVAVMEFLLPDETGWYETALKITDGTGTLEHQLVYCVTPESGRVVSKEASPYSTWWFSAHGSPGDNKIGGPILQKAGIRKAAWNKLSKESCEKYDITTSGFIYAPRAGEFDAKTGHFRGGKLKKDGKMVDVDGEELVVARMKGECASKPFVDHIMVWHESAPQCGIPEELLGLAAPTNDVAREKLLAAYLNEVGRICRKHFPNLKIQIGNSNAGIGAPTVVLRGGANPDYIDILGMEIPSQTIAPERPHDFGFWGQNVTKAIAKKLSGRDIPTGGCYEFIYRAERDLGPDGEQMQAEFHARDILMALMNNYTLISPGILFDCRNAYCNTLWGVSGILRRSPYVYPKKSYLAYAVITKVLDGVTYLRSLDTGSSTVYAAEFRRADGKIATAFWCARGEAELVVDASGELWTMYGKREDVGGWFSDAKFTCGTAPVYLVTSKPCKGVKIARRMFAVDGARVAKSQTVGSFSADNVTVAPDPAFASTHHAFLPIMKPGAFTVKDVVDEQEGPCLEVTLDTSKNADKVTEFITEYTTLHLKKPIEVPGPAALLGLRVKGNSNWAQLRFEITDAKGETFTGKSTGKSWGCDVFDWPGYMAVSFDGWGDVYQYVDSNEMGLAISPGPRFEQWVSGGGDKTVQWPVRITGITVPMNRFKPTILGFEKASVNPSIRLKGAWYVPRK